VIENEGAPYLTESLINIIAVYISGFVYVIISFITILRYKRNMLNQFSNTEKVNYNWLLYLIIWLAVLWIIILFVQYDEVIFGAAVIFIVWLGYFGIKNVQVFSQHKPHAFAGKPDFEMLLADLNNYAGDDAADEQLSADTKYVGSVLSKSAIESIQLALKELMGQNKIYTNPDLTLDDLAEMIKVHPNHLSQVINSVMGKTFYDYINELRVKEFTEQINLPQKQQFTILAIAFDCGFNSKASFYRNFKKFTGLTPSDYMQMHNKLQN
jgi:AraC-like DNA-binding protein